MKTSEQEKAMMLDFLCLRSIENYHYNSGFLQWKIFIDSHKPYIHNTKYQFLKAIRAEMNKTLKELNENILREGSEEQLYNLLVRWDKKFNKTETND